MRKRKKKRKAPGFKKRRGWRAGREREERGEGREWREGMERREETERREVRGGKRGRKRNV